MQPMIDRFLRFGETRSCGAVRRMTGIAVIVAALANAIPANAHIFVFESQRGGAVECTGAGTGWFVECFWGIPEEEAEHLLTAEDYADTVEPTFTFQASYIDWPAGEVAHAPDTSFATLGDFLNDYLSDVSDPKALEAPFNQHFLLRATGYVNAQLADSSIQPGPPVWMEFGLATFDGGRVKLDETTIFRIVVPIPPDGFFTENAIIDLPGAFPITVTYFQKFDPDNLAGADQAGVELYTCNPFGLDYPTGDQMLCYADTATVTPPSLIFQEEQIVDVMPGDFDADNDIDLVDFGYLQRCFTGPNYEGYLENGCDELDIDFDSDVDLIDFWIVSQLFTGPNGCK